MFSSYTYTDISSGFFEAAQERFKGYESRMVYKTFDMERPPSSQGFVEGSYDLILASNVLHATDKLEEMMVHVRQLLKPGGYLICLELTSNDTMRVGLPMGSLPGWWVGADNGRPWGPTVTLPQWDTLLRKSGFGGIDTSTPLLHELHVSVVFAAQAVDDRISLLRTSLASLNALPPTDAPRLVVLGGEGIATHRIADRITGLLAPRFNQIVRITSIDDLDLDVLPYSSTVLSLTELDEPIFKNMTPARLNALKTLWRQAGKILWITRGARAQEPLSSMMLGLGRAMTHEYPNMSLQVFDIDRFEDEEKTTQVLVEELLRLEILKKWQHDSQDAEDFLWSIEPEVCFEARSRMIPRLYKCESANERYNSARRAVMRKISVNESFLFVSEGNSYQFEQPSPLRTPVAAPMFGDTKTIQVSHFLGQTIRVGSLGKLMLCTGTDLSDGKQLLALSHSMESRPTVLTDWTLSFHNQDLDLPRILTAFAAYIIAIDILKLAPGGSTIVVHEPDEWVGSALAQQCQQFSIRVVVTTSLKSHGQGWLYIPDNLSRRLIKEALPDSISLYIDLSKSPGSVRVGRLIAKHITRACPKYSSRDFLGSTAELRSGTPPGQIAQVLRAAYNTAVELQSRTANPKVIDIQDVPGLAVEDMPLAVIDCSEPSAPISVNIQSIDSGMIFRPDKTYLLVGMSGQVGQSLAQWLVERGASFVVLTSRRPQVHPDFVKSLETRGATIKILPL